MSLKTMESLARLQKLMKNTVWSSKHRKKYVLNVG